MTNSGLDINQSNGSGEDFKDIIFVTVACQTLGAFVSVYFWWAWTLIPCVAFYRLWVSVLAPWFFKQPEEVDEKKLKKQERKMKRAQQPMYR